MPEYGRYGKRDRVGRAREEHMASGDEASSEDEELEFSYGDLVQLKSGGPPMTVEGLPGERIHARHAPGNYWCTWFKGATRDSGGFPEHIIQAYVPPSKK